jgi:hypothetical protein
MFQSPDDRGLKMSQVNWTNFSEPIHILASVWSIPVDENNPADNMMKQDFGKGLISSTEKRLIVIGNYLSLDVLVRYKGLETGWKLTQQKEIYNFVIGSWDCESSPYGHCIFDHENDPAHDHCLFCGGPDERK